ncbi:hypothetical protein TrCOL_g5657 [Triparma columacea]|uniref:Ankyrin n=1 Tax=Triparma columacea TaxID=722753 RepID=A0A9W7LET5_9STRA|nr:hypothetical protein TrCOL_g5657 [Triparma columacea]
MSDYDDDDFEEGDASGGEPVIAPTRPPGSKSAANALRMAASEVEAERGGGGNEENEGSENGGSGRGGGGRKGGRGGGGGGIPSASVPLSKKEKKKRRRKKKERKRGGGEEDSSESEFLYKSRVWNSSKPGFNSGRSLFRASTEKMKELGFDEEIAKGGTRVGSALMHASFAGDNFKEDVENLLKKEKKKKKGKGRRRDDSDSDSDAMDDITRKVVGWSTMLGQDWGNDVREVDGNGWTALHYAASKGEIEIMKLLVKEDGKREGGGEDEGGEDLLGEGGSSARLLDMKDSLFGWTALNIASIALNVEAVESLLELGANANMVDDLGDTALDSVAKTGRGGKRSRKRDEVRRMLKEAMDDEQWDLSSESESEEEEEESSSSEKESSGEEEDEEESESD